MPGVCKYGNVPLSLLENIIMRMGTTTQEPLIVYYYICVIGIVVVVVLLLYFHGTQLCHVMTVS